MRTFPSSQTETAKIKQDLANHKARLLLLIELALLWKGELRHNIKIRVGDEVIKTKTTEGLNLKSLSCCDLLTVYDKMKFDGNKIEENTDD